MKIPNLVEGDLKIRHAKTEDIETMLYLSEGVDLSLLAGNRSGPVTAGFLGELFSEFENNPDRTVYVIELEDKPCGWISCYTSVPSEGDLFIDAIVIGQAFRSRRNGSRAAALIIDWANRHDELVTVIAGMDAGNDAAQMFWENLEFIPLEEKAGILTMVYQLGSD